MLEDYVALVLPGVIFLSCGIGLLLYWIFG